MSENRELRLLRQKKYKKSEKGKATKQAYKRSVSGKAETKRHSRTPKGRYQQNKTAALRRGLSWDINFTEWLVIKAQRCYYCASEGPGLDRVDNKIGYTLSNILPACGRCNKSRNNFYTVDEFKIMMEALLEYQRTICVSDSQ